jgi:DNA polymerase-4
MNTTKSGVFSRVIFHVDMDAFYASVEQRDNPGWRGLPVLVGGTGPRGVVAAASYEARRFGVRSAMPMSEALRRCPGAICARPRMDRYREVSMMVFAIFRGVTPLVQGLSLDEAFLDVSDQVRTRRQARELGKSIKQQILKATGLTASVGIGPNKLVAKIASDLEKPDGLVLVGKKDVREILDPLPVRAINGIGPRTGEALEERGIHLIRDLRICPVELLTPVFGRFTRRMLDKASGIDDRPVETSGKAKSISAEETFDEDLLDLPGMLEQLSLISIRTARRLAARELQATTVSVKIRDREFRTVTRQHSFSPATQSVDMLEKTARHLLEQWRAEHPYSGVRLLGVGVSGLEPARQMDLFASEVETNSSQVQELIKEVRQRYGNKALRKGQELDEKRQA